MHIQPIVSFSEDCAVCVYQSQDEDYILQLSDDSEKSYETLEALYNALTVLDLKGMLIPSSTFHDIEVLLAHQNRLGRTERYEDYSSTADEDNDS